MTASGSRTFVFVTAALVAVAIAQAQQPPSTAKPTTVASSVPSATQAARKAAADGKLTQSQAAKASAVEKRPDPSPQLIRAARNSGFRPQEVRGNLMFCRVAIELGSNFPVKTCYNEEQVKIKIQEYQAQRNQLQQQHFLPPPVPHLECQPNC